MHRSLLHCLYEVIPDCTRLENTPFGYARHRIVTDRKGVPIDYIFLEVNDAFEKLTGLTREQVLGRHASEVMPEQGGHRGSGSTSMVRSPFFGKRKNSCSTALHGIAGSKYLPFLLENAISTPLYRCYLREGTIH
ncbi:MAG: PAS domain S-box protein [Marinilabiliales bacterium]|nr:PAS domain S-box protein [Marinilabiliales bacterium]